MATKEDLERVKCWLKQEYDVDRNGFWCNEKHISERQNCDEMHVLIEDGDPVAFLVGSNLRLDILSVRKEKRRRGYGKALATFALKRADERAGACIVKIECAPSDSFNFWQRIGFEKYTDRYCPHKTAAFYMFPRSLNAPSGEIVDVNISTYSEGTNGRNANQPIREWKRSAVKAGDRIRFRDRIIFFDAQTPIFHDSVVEIRVGGKLIVDGRLKCCCSRNLGIKKGPCGTFFMDELLVTQCSSARLS